LEIIWLGEPASMNATIVGGKAAALGRLRTRYRVPAGFCVCWESLDSSDEEWSALWTELLAAEVFGQTWTPLYRIIGGIAVDHGGLLSHAAVVAREYRLPMVAVSDGTAVIRDGQLIEVNGDAGAVRILES